MKTKEIAERFKLDKGEFETFLRVRNKQYTDNILFISVNDSLVPSYVLEFREYEKNENEKKRERQRIEQEQRLEREKEEQEKRIAMSKMLISSGFSFDGYRIVKYSGYISGDDATQIPRSGIFGSNNGAKLTTALVEIRRQALKELKEAAYDLGCNAVVGVDFDYITLEPETANFNGGTLYEPYIICVTANGNAVVIEKIDDEQHSAPSNQFSATPYDDPFS